MTGSSRRLAPVFGALVSAFAAMAFAAPPAPDARAAAAALATERGSGVTVAWRPATGTARSVRFESGARRAEPAGRVARESVLAVLDRSAALFGVADARTELRLESERLDRFGFRHLTFRQERFGVPAFGALLRAHVDPAGAITSIEATTFPTGALDRMAVEPRVAVASARAVAARWVGARVGHAGEETPIESSRLVVFALGLDRGLGFEPLLAWEIVAGGGLDRQRVFVDARTGKPIDSLPLVADELDRRSFTGSDQAPFDGVPDSWPEEPDWIEGDPFPTGTFERDAALEATADAYELFAAFGRDSYDGAGHALDVSWNRASFCPNASWNGLLVSFCSGFATHDVVVHEWAHAYTQETDGLIYRWQSGALNESYSDVWGELADQASTLEQGRDVDVPARRRADETCSGFEPARFRIVSPPALAGDRRVGLAAFGPPATSMPAVPVVYAEDGAGASAHDACEPLINAAAAAGAILFVDRGGCGFEEPARNAQAAGAIGLLVGNLPESPAPGAPPELDCDAVAGCDLSIAIPALSLAANDAGALRGALAAGPVKGALEAGTNRGADDSVRWLLGEDVRPLGVGRDMWKPSCLGAPDRTGDTLYRCSSADGGGVHTNSGVPNRVFALLVDGGRADGIDVPAIGRVAAAWFHWRAQTEYLLPYSDFADQADALEASCADLLGVALDDPWGGPARTIGAADCAAVAAAIAAVELRAEPPCSFEPILAKNPPPLCPAYELELARASFDAGADGWIASRRDVADPATFEPRDWTRTSALPEARPGEAFFAPDPHAGSCVTDQGPDDESGVLVLESPALGSPIGLPLRLAFEHFVATEAGWDGGNLKVSVEGGAWQLVPGSAFLFNGYPDDLLDVEDGNSDPLAGEEAFEGLDDGSNSGSWGRSIVDLSALVPPGRSFRLRFEFGTDECAGSDQGWYVDEVELAACVSAPPLFFDGFEGGDASRWSETTS